MAAFVLRSQRSSLLRATAVGAALLVGGGLVACGTSSPPVATRCAPGDQPLVQCASGEKSTPFTCVRFTKNCLLDVQTEVDGPWYRLEAVNGVSAEGVLAVAQRACPDAWKKRIAEDLPALMTGVCAPLGNQAELLLRDLATDRVHQAAAVVNGDNRTRTKACWAPMDECRS